MKFTVDRSIPEFRRNPIHRHGQIEIQLCLEGKGIFKTPETEAPVEPGTAILIPAGTLHHTMGEPGFFNVCIRADFSHIALLEKPLILQDNEEGDGARLAEMLFRHRHRVTPFVQELASALLRFLLQQADLSRHNDAAVDQIYQEIARGALDQEIDVAAILASGGYAPDYIRMLFKKRHGISPLRLVAKLRIDHACSLLETYRDSLPLSEIATQCGYEDYIYFSKTFKAQTGLSPRNYLNQLMKN